MICRRRTEDPFPCLSGICRAGLIVTLDRDLGKHRERDMIFRRAKLLDLGFGPGFLCAEIVGREAEHVKSLVLVLCIRRLQSFVLRRVAAFARDIYDQQDIALVFLELDVLAVDVPHFEIKHRFCPPLSLRRSTMVAIKDTGTRNACDQTR